ncbi:ras guanine nucleotide exchange factor E-like [Aphis gossypii]|uniref:ras guanine nucleotide exchange factor E-like n=1 Tax=Aphis gossypii TaxID=80765 RepID=UPI0021590E9A|nr:ras guanine nucleotide exchange factor E-like [Aphis gossypii]
MISFRRVGDNLETDTSLDSYDNKSDILYLDNVHSACSSYQYDTKNLSESFCSTVGVSAEFNTSSSSYLSSCEHDINVSGYDQGGIKMSCLKNLEFDTLSSVGSDTSFNNQTSFEKSNTELSESLCEFMNVTSTTLDHFEFDHSLNESKNIEKSISTCEKFKTEEDIGLESCNSPSSNLINTSNVIDSNTNENSVSKKSYGIRKSDITISGFSSSKKTKDLESLKNESVKKKTLSKEIIKPGSIGVTRSSSLRSNTSTISKSSLSSNKTKVTRSESTKTVRSSFESKTSTQNESVSIQSKMVGTKSNVIKSSSSFSAKADAESKKFKSLNSSKKVARNILSSSASEVESVKNIEYKSSTFTSNTQSLNQSLTKKTNTRQEFNESKQIQKVRDISTSLKVASSAKMSNESSTKSITTVNKKNYSTIEQTSKTKLLDSKSSTKIEKYHKTTVNEKLKNKQVVEVPETSPRPKLKSYMASTESRNRKLENISHSHSKTSDVSTKYHRIIPDKQKKVPTSPSRIPIKDNSSKIISKMNLSLLDTRSSSILDPRVLSAPSQRSGFDFMSSPRKISPTSLPVSPAHRCLKADKKISSVLITSEVFSSSTDRVSSVELVYEQPKRSPCSSMSEQQPASITESVSLDDEETTHSSTSDTNRDSEVYTQLF